MGAPGTLGHLKSNWMPTCEPLIQIQGIYTCIHYPDFYLELRTWAVRCYLCAYALLPDVEVEESVSAEG